VNAPPKGRGSITRYAPVPFPFPFNGGVEGNTSGVARSDGVVGLCGIGVVWMVLSTRWYFDIYMCVVPPIRVQIPYITIPIRTRQLPVPFGGLSH
jgi:hypothetical protein